VIIVVQRVVGGVNGFALTLTSLAGRLRRCATLRRCWVFQQLVLAGIIEPASKIDSFEPTQAGHVGRRS
jgi:hypothetical protein